MEEKRLPIGFLKMVGDLFGVIEGKELIDALSETESPVSIRLNPRKRSEGELYPDMDAVPWNPNGFYLKERPVFTTNPLLHAGTFYVQEAASMIHGWIVSRMNFSSPVRAVDLCAAPGGKTGAVLDALPEGSIMVANEFVGQRANILRENMEKQGSPDVVITNSPVDVIGRLGSTFDLMIADVPCSGEGMMRKEAIARSQWSPGLIDDCSKLQRDILNDALPALKPGGYLIYSTCTFNTKENEENVRWLIEEHGLENIYIDFPEEWNIMPSLTEDIKAMRFLPHRTKSEGLFVALLRKPVDAEAFPAQFMKPKEKRGAKQRGSGPATHVDTEKLKKWVQSGTAVEIAVDEKGSVWVASRDTMKLASELKEAGARILKSGVEIAELKGRDLMPTTSLALSTVLNPDYFLSVEVSKEDALSYLRHEVLRLPEKTPKGFIIVKYKGERLGFVKNIGTRANNLYPREWRIRNL